MVSLRSKIPISKVTQVHVSCRCARNRRSMFSKAWTDVIRVGNDAFLQVLAFVAVVQLSKSGLTSF